jgi:hypothetical protein
MRVSLLAEEFLRNRVLKTRAPVYHLPVCARAPIQANKPQFIIRLVRVLTYHLTSIRRSPR